jgi:rhomboid family GlyGly-CTERM serine protease
MSNLDSKLDYSKGPARLGRVWWAPVALIVLTGVLQAIPGASAVLSYQRSAIGAGQLWRLWTCHFVHLSFAHWALNACGLLLLPLLCDESLFISAWIMLVIWLATAVGLGLYWNAPSVEDYVGLSGILYGLFSLGFLRQMWRGDWIAAACLVVLAWRVTWGFRGGASAAEEQMIGGHVIAQSHLYGMGTALISALVLKVVSKTRFFYRFCKGRIFP